MRMEGGGGENKCHSRLSTDPDFFALRTLTQEGGGGEDAFEPRLGIGPDSARGSSCKNFTVNGTVLHSGSFPPLCLA